MSQSKCGTRRRLSRASPSGASLLSGSCDGRALAQYSSVTCYGRLSCLGNERHLDHKATTHSKVHSTVCLGPPLPHTFPTNVPYVLCRLLPLLFRIQSVARATQAGAIRMARYSRRSRGRRRAAGTGRAVRGYTLRDRKGRIRYYGTSNNPSRRATEHKQAGKRGKMKVETRPMSRAKARRWEAGRLAGYRRNHRGKNPVHNKTRSGGWKS